MKNVALTPPKGWNSWDAYGASVTEAEVRQNAEVLSQKLKRFGWNYVVVDIQWYEPTADSSEYHNFAPLTLDKYSRVIPAENRFPSSKNGNGFKKLSDYIHNLGLKFGIHILRGIPREAVHKRMAIKGTNKTADQIATNTICPWNSDMYGVNMSLPEGQLYYDSLIDLYASWGVDFLKVDDISNSTLYPKAHLAEIAGIRNSLNKVNRDIILSLSPGPAHLQDGSFLREHANMWRLTDDFWDDWNLLYGMFEKCNEWSPFVDKARGNWPDCDMLPLGHIGIRSKERGLSDRNTRFTKAEQKTMMTLWYIFQSPLFFGGELTDLDSETLNLLINNELNKMHASLISQKQEYRDDCWIVWSAKSNDNHYAALFNVSDKSLRIPSSILSKYFSNENSIELWNDKLFAETDKTLNAHDCLIIKE